ncbi:MAG TPA: histidine kinase [Jatrophihabitans sp.]
MFYLRGHFHPDPEIGTGADRVYADLGVAGVREWVQSFGVDARHAHQKLPVSGDPPRFVRVLRRHGAGRALADVAFAAIHNSQGAPRGLVVVGRDADSDRFEASDLHAIEGAADAIALGLTLVATRAVERAAHHRLSELAEQRRVLLAELVAAEQAERSRIAADVHDDALQTLTAAHLRVELMFKHFDNERYDLARDAGGSRRAGNDLRASRSPRRPRHAQQDDRPRRIVHDRTESDRRYARAATRPPHRGLNDQLARIARQRGIRAC